ncbi:WXG100 family type VII secretion target (plasmid) [Streptomyces sp. NBC_01471]|uniref:WXG100 family type VII secretion target n=1 Tax=Streptomyces sp. NBC_01471 TaxID=2903879 RepID=UPI002F9071CC
MEIHSLAEFKADLKEMKVALGVAQHESAQIDHQLTTLGAEFATLNTTWQSPSSATYEEVQRWFNAAAADLRRVLEDGVHRLDKAIANYEKAEEANFHNVT